jgi:hypothetical protein
VKPEGPYEGEKMRGGPPEGDGVKGGPPERMCHTLVALEGGRLITLGGRNKECIFADAWCLVMVRRMDLCRCIVPFWWKECIFVAAWGLVMVRRMHLCGCVVLCHGQMGYLLHTQHYCCVAPVSGHLPSFVRQ